MPAKQLSRLTDRLTGDSRPDSQSCGAIDITALISLEGSVQAGGPLYFLAPRGGGTEVRYGRRDILVITPQSPLGQQLLGRRKGDRISFGRPAADYRIATVC